MPKILLEIPDKQKADEFLKYFVPNLNFILKAEEVASDKKMIEDSKLPLYDPEKYDYSLEDMQAIASHFPEDHHWTFDDLIQYFPEDLKISIQIIQNKLYIMPGPSSTHQIIVNELVFELYSFVKRNQLGQILPAPMDVKFDENNTFQPDILFIAVSRYEIIKEKRIEGVPNLVVEIWSPSNTSQEKKDKHEVYEKNKVTEYWQIEPKAQKVSIEVLNDLGKYEIFSEAEKTGIVCSKVLEGFELDLESLFPEEKSS